MLPAIDIHALAITPSAGSPLGGEWVQITGVTGGPGTAVTFGGVPAPYVDSSAAPPLLHVLTPPGAGQVDVVLTAPGAATTQQLSFGYTELTVSVIRPDDLLNLRFELVNLELDGADVVRRDPAADAFVVVSFPPQHIAEAGSPGGQAPPAPPVTAALAGESRLAFRVPPTTTRLPLTLASLLAWDALTLVPGAGVAGTPAQPAGYATALELPYRMILTIDRVLGWQLSAPATDPSSEVTELWRATIQGPSLRVAWSPELSPRSPLGPVDAGTPGAADRTTIAAQAPALTSGDMTLSALGASVDLQAVLGEDSDVSSWRQVIADGRDSYVRLVKRGFLAPWGHRASVVEVVDREPESAADGTAVAGLATWTTVVVTQPVVSYAGPSPDSPNQHLALPFVSVRITTLVTAQTDMPDSEITVVGNSAGPLLFHLVATDHGGREVDLTMPLVFVPATLASDTQRIAGALAAGTVHLAGQQVNFVPPPAAPAAEQALASGPAPASEQAPAGMARARIAPDDIGAAANAGLLTVSSMQFTVDLLSTAVPLPNLSSAQVTVPGLEAVQAGASWAIRYHPTYLTQGFSAANVGQLFASVIDKPTLGLPAGAAGGLAAPALAVHNLSQVLGPVGDIDSLITKPQAILDTGAKLLGQLTLADFLQDLPLDKLPRLVRTPLPNGVRIGFDWSPPLKSWAVPPPPSSPVLEIDLANSSLTLHSESSVYTDRTPPRAVVTGTLTNPGLSFFRSVILTLDVLAFTAEAGKKADLTTGHLSIDLEGDLAFLKPLVQALPADGFSDPPYLDVTSDGITAGYSAALPAIGLGILSIENLAVSAALSLPFAAPLGLKVAFSSREHPFLVTVSLIGGGGYFIIDVGADGIRQVEGALELGAQLDVDLLIVTANVYVLAGFYFMVGQAGTSFSGFVRIGGSVDLLGLISVSIELYLALAYDKTPGAPASIVGSASLTLSVHVLLVTKTLTLSVEKRFPVPGAAAPSAIRSSAALSRAAEEPGPLPLDSWLSIDEWRTYRQAFVAETA